MELNPNHKVVVQARGEWHKIAALLLHKSGKTEIEITEEDINTFVASPMRNIVLDARQESAGRGLIVRLVDDKEAEKLDRQEGGRAIDN